MIDQTHPQFKAAIDEVLVPFGLAYSLPLATFNTPPVQLKNLIKALQKQSKSEVIALGEGAIFDVARKHIFHNGQTIELTEKETLLLKTLWDAGAEIPRETLLKTVWGYADDIDTHTLETHIHRLRAKLKTLPEEPEYIRTTAFGYQFHGTGSHS